MNCCVASSVTEKPKNDERLRARLSRIFDMKDFRKVGKVEEKDFVEWGRRSAYCAGVEYTPEIQDDWKAAHKEYFGDRITKDAWIEGIFYWRSLESSKEATIATNSLLFKCVDLNKDEKGTFKEYYAFVHPLGISEDDAKKSFDIIDSNGDGTLSVEEFSTACFHYYADLEASPYENFYGIYNESTTS